MAYVDTFTGGAVQPSDLSYVALALTVNTQLNWADFPSATTTTAARIMDISTTGALTISLPSAIQVATGQDTLIRNTGATTFTIADLGGNTVTTVAAGTVKYVYLSNNSTANGVWQTLTFGVGSSTVDAAALAGLGVKAIGASLNQTHPATTVSSSFTIGAADRARLYLTSAGITITLPLAASMGNDFFFILRNTSGGTTTVTPAGGETIDAEASLSLSLTESCLICCTGTAWFTVGRGRSTVFVYNQLVKSVAGGATVTLTTTEAGYKLLKFTGAITANINIIVPSVTTIWYVDNSTTGAFTLTVKTLSGTGVIINTTARVILYGDGTNVLDAQTVFATSTLFAAGSAAAPSISFAADTDTGLYSAAANELGVTTAGVTVGSFTSSGWVGNVSGGPPVTVVTATTQAAVAGNHYVLTNAGATTVTLPASPTSGHIVWVTVNNGLTTNIIARNAQTIMGLAEDMTIDVATVTVRLRFINSSWRLL